MSKENEIEAAKQSAKGYAEKFGNNLWNKESELEHAFLDGVEWHKSLINGKEGWVDVKDELPPLGEEVLVYCPDCNKKITALCRFTRYEESKDFYWDNFYGGSNVHIQTAITHWQKLPSKPKQ